MKIKIYVNWQDEEILQEKDYQKRIEQKTEDYSENKDYFDEFLTDETYSLEQVFNFTEDERKEIRKRFLEQCKDWAKDRIENDFEMITLEI